MKFTIETEEKEEVLRMLQANAALSALWEIAWGKIRDWSKYGSDCKSPEEAIDKCREEIFRIIDNYNINFEEDY